MCVIRVILLLRCVGGSIPDRRSGVRLGAGLGSGAGDEALPATRIVEKQWTRATRTRLGEWPGMADCMLLDENEPCDAPMERCAAIEARANGLKV